MSTITADDLDKLRHMLGVSGRSRRGYRNYYCAGPNDVPSMERLRAAGFVEKVADGRYYHATLEGGRAVGLTALPK